MLLAGADQELRHIAVVFPAVLLGGWFMTHKAYRMKRITAFTHPCGKIHRGMDTT